MSQRVGSDMVPLGVFGLTAPLSLALLLKDDAL